MTKTIRFGLACLAVSFVLVSTTATGVSANTETADRSSDVWIEATIFTSYLLNDHLSALAIDIDVSDGVVALNGAVDSDVERDLAEEIAAGVEGVRTVDNKLTIDKSESMGDFAARKTNAFARLVGNASTSARVKSRLLWNSHTNGLDIDVRSEDGTVTLAGVVESDEVKNLAGVLAGNTTGVEKVMNGITVDTGISSARSSTGSALHDVWITTKIQASLLFDKRANDYDIDVTTKNGVVTLEGNVGSGAMEQAVVAIVSDIVGVKEVRSELDKNA